MSDSLQIRFVRLLCLRCAGPTEELSRDELIFGLGCNEESFAETEREFIAKKFIGEKWSVTNWDKRQYVSDSSADRVRRFRQKKQALKQGETLRNGVSVTGRNAECNAPEQNRTEQNRTEQTEALSPSAPVAAKKRSPKTAVFELPDWVNREAWDAYVEMRTKSKKPLTEYAKNLEVVALTRLRDSGDDPTAVLDQSVRKSWQGLYPLKLDDPSKIEPPKPKKKFYHMDGTPVVGNGMGDLDAELFD
jgi:hypothetical protein